MRVAPRTKVRVIPDLLHGRDEDLKRDTEFRAVRGKRARWPRARHGALDAPGASQAIESCKQQRSSAAGGGLAAGIGTKPAADSSLLSRLGGERSRRDRLSCGCSGAASG